MNNLFKNWSITRILRLTAGIGIAIYAVVSENYMFLLLSIILIVQSIINMSCCGCSSEGCNINREDK
ncbi:MAG: hypothetical protein RR293_03390 [Bacteroidales bacterium]